MLSAQALGEATKAIELTLDWVKQRKAFGAPLWDKQVIRQRLSMRLAQVEAARALLFNTAWRDTRNENVVKEVSMLKALAGTLVNEVMYDCLQFHGGMGYMRESADRAHGPRRPRAVDRRRRHRGDAGRGGQAHLTAVPRMEPSAVCMVLLAIMSRKKGTTPCRSCSG